MQVVVRGSDPVNLDPDPVNLHPDPQPCLQTADLTTMHTSEYTVLGRDSLYTDIRRLYLQYRQIVISTQSHAHLI